MSGDVDKSGQQSSSKGLREFFRKKTQGGSTRTLETCGTSEGDGTALGASLDVPDGNMLSVRSDELSGSAYGNYLTVSGTGASILKDLFHKKYRGSEVNDPSTAADGKESKKKISFGQPTFFGFRSKKDKGQEGTFASSDLESQARSSTKAPKDVRNRHKSGPEKAFSVTVVDVDSKAKQGKMRAFLDSFRSHPKAESLSFDADYGDPTVGRQPRVYEPHDVGYKSVTGKGKKFRVTPAAKKDVEIGPNEFVEMYRNRAFSDSRPQDLLAARAAAAARQKKLSGHSPPCNRADINGFEYQEDRLHVVVWRDKKKGTKIFQLPKDDVGNAVSDEFGDSNDADLAYTRFMKSHTCYDLIPNSSKLVIFDTRLTVKKAFLALVVNGVRAAVLWDTDLQDFAGMLTVTDFIQVLQKYYHSSQELLTEVEDNKIATWKELWECKRRMVCIEPEYHLLDAVRSLCYNKVHRLLIVDSFRGNPLNLLSYKRLLKFLHQNMSHLRRPLFMDKTLEELKVGTYENLATLITDAPLIHALKLFLERRISAIPIVDSEGRAIDLFAKIDIVSLIQDKLYSDLDVSIMEVLETRRENFQGVITCKKTETLQTVVDKIVSSSVHRLIVVDENDHVEGIVSLSDVLHYLVLSPAESRAKASSDDEQLEDTAESVTANKESSDSALDSTHKSDSVESKEEVEKEDFESKSTSGMNEGDQPQIESGASDISVIVTNSECTPAAL